MTTWTNISGGSAISESLADQAATSAADASNSATSASTSATAAEAAKTAAQASETASAASETASAASEAAAASSETAAAASEAAASSSETAAASSATSAGTSATNAATSASNASTSAANAATSESNAATSESNASTSATNAATSASGAASSATAAASSATAAAASETAAAASETAAAASETAAASSETAAAASESAAAASETAAAGSATSASSSATSASTSASGAATSATNAATSESNAATSESNASTSASSADTSATAAAGSATSASNSASSSAADQATFQGQYHGASATAPTTGLDTGDLYFDTVADAMKVYDGSSWVAAYISSAGTLAAANNLSDVSSASASRTNLGLGTIATQAANSVAITGGSISGITDLAVADGGTGASTASAARTNLGLVIGTDVQAYDAGLADIAGLAVTDGNVIVGNGSNWVAESGATARTSLGLGTMATQAATGVDIDGGTIDGATIGGTSAGAVTATTLTATDASVISVSSSSDALRITQTGAGNALLVEDSTNPDSTPFVVDASGNVGIGCSPSKTLDVDGQLRIRNGGATGYALLEYGASATATNNWHVGSEGDGTYRFYNGNFGAGSERMRIDSSGNVGIGRTATTNKLEVAGTIESTSGGFKFPDGSTQSSAGASTGKAIAMAIVFGG